MSKFRRGDHERVHHEERLLSKEELDTKHAAALEAKSLISWTSPDRVFKARSKKYFVKVGLYGIIFILLAIVLREPFLVGVILSVMFVVYVLASHEPETIEHRVTHMGIVSGGRPFLWSEMDSFWFDRRGDDHLLIVQTHLKFPSRLIIILNSISERTLLDILEKHLHDHEGPVHTLFDRWANFLHERINLE